MRINHLGNTCWRKKAKSLGLSSNPLNSDWHSFLFLGPGTSVTQEVLVVPCFPDADMDSYLQIKGRLGGCIILQEGGYTFENTFSFRTCENLHAISSVMEIANQLMAFVNPFIDVVNLLITPIMNTFIDIGAEAISSAFDGLSELPIPIDDLIGFCLLYTSPSPRDLSTSRMPSSA